MVVAKQAAGRCAHPGVEQQFTTLRVGALTLCGCAQPDNVEIANMIDRELGGSKGGKGGKAKGAKAKGGRKARKARKPRKPRKARGRGKRRAAKKDTTPAGDEFDRFNENSDWDLKKAGPGRSGSKGSSGNGSGVGLDRERKQGKKAAKKKQKKKSAALVGAQPITGFFAPSQRGAAPLPKGESFERAAALVATVVMTMGLFQSTRAPTVP